MDVITLHNEAGGVGKSTLAWHLAAGLAAQGLHVVLMDADPQGGNLTALMGQPRRPMLYDLLVRDALWDEVVVWIDPTTYTLPTSNVTPGELLLVASNHETQTIASNVYNTFVVAERLHELRTGGEVDVVVIDTSPHPDALNGMVFTASDYILFATQAERKSLNGLRDTFNRMARFMHQRAVEGHGAAQVLGIVPTMVQATTVDHSEHLAQLRAAYGDKVLSAIPRSIAWAEACSGQQADRKSVV